MVTNLGITNLEDNTIHFAYSDIVNNEEGLKDIIKRFNLINKRIIVVRERISKIKRILNG